MTKNPAGTISDGYHTFDELYEHRHRLFIALIWANVFEAWYSPVHSDGTAMDGWFLAGLVLPSGTITYHLPDRLMADMRKTPATRLDQAPEWDGHTSDDVLIRLKDLIEPPANPNPTPWQ